MPHKYCVTVAWRKFLPLCTFLNIGSLEPGLVVLNTVHLLHMEHLFASLFMLGRKWCAVLDDKMQELSRLPTPLTAHQDMFFLQAKALRCLVFLKCLIYLDLPTTLTRTLGT